MLPIHIKVFAHKMLKPNIGYLRIFLTSESSEIIFFSHKLKLVIEILYRNVHPLFYEGVKLNTFKAFVFVSYRIIFLMSNRIVNNGNDLK